jgi:hypothetical protein
MKLTKEKLLRIINEEIEVVKEIEFEGEPMSHKGQEFKTGLGAGNTADDMHDAEQTIEEKISDMVMVELEKEVQELAGGSLSDPEMAQVDDDLLAIAMRIRDKIMADIGASIEAEVASAKQQIRKLASIID